MDKFLSEMAERQAREDAERGTGTSPQGNRNARTISRDDLKAMMDRIEEMARSGNLADAQRMLEQMQSVLENLRTAKRGRKNQRAQEMSRALDDLDALTRDQQALRDDTYRGDRPQRGQKSRAVTTLPAAIAGRRRTGGRLPTTPSGSDMQTSRRMPAASSSARRRCAKNSAICSAASTHAPEKRRFLGDAGGAMKEAEDALDDGGEGRRPGEKATAQGGRNRRGPGIGRRGAGPRP